MSNRPKPSRCHRQNKESKYNCVLRTKLVLNKAIYWRKDDLSHREHRQDKCRIVFRQGESVAVRPDLCFYEGWQETDDVVILHVSDCDSEETC